MLISLRLMAIALALAITTACAVDDDVPPHSTTVPDRGALIVTPSTEIEPSESGAPAIWRLSDADTTLHLFGTVHTLKPETDWQTIGFAQIFSAADALYLEADTTSQEALLPLPGLIASLAPFTDGRTLNDVLDEEGQREVSEAAALLGIPLDSLTSFRPWFVALTLSQTQTQQAGYLEDKGVEWVLRTQAQKAGKPLRYLETAEDQIRALAGLSDNTATDFLIETAISVEDNPDFLDALVAEWQVGDLADLQTLIESDKSFAVNEIKEVLLTRRNENWTDQIVTLMEREEGQFLIAVGAAHLVGENSVPAMLEARGYTLTLQ